MNTAPNQQYWDDVHRFIQYEWAKLDLVTRMALVDQAGDPLDLAMQDTVPTEARVWPDLYALIEGRN